MPVQHISVEQLWEFSGLYPVLDVRSPAEYNHARIPGAYSLPLFSDEERKLIGTTYKQESREKAVKYGLDFFGVKMRKMVEETERIVKAHRKAVSSATPAPDSKKIIVHCWRGGMRSSAVAWLLGFYGFEVYLLEGGYKVFRHWVLAQFENQYSFTILGGYTGSGKTEILHALRQSGQPVIDLEGMASHKGSSFGALGQPPQPSQEMFENLLAIALFENSGHTFWLEDESQRIGVLNIPHAFWKSMRTKPVYFLDIPFEQRLQQVIAGYGSLEKELLVNAIIRIKQRLGPLETKTAIGYLVEDNIIESFRILLQYYDKTYQKALEKRDNFSALINRVASNVVDPEINTQKILLCKPVNA